MNTKPLLIADIGGTNARFALASNNAPYFEQAETLLCADYENSEKAIEHYLNSQNVGSLAGICFAVAGPIKHESVSLINNHWSISADTLKEFFETKQVTLLNDFEAIAYSLANLEAHDIELVGDPDTLGREFDRSKDFTVAVVGPGSGLGIAGLKQQRGVLYPLSTEGGHSGFAPDNPLQDELLRSLRSKFNRVSNERLLSGPGLMNIHKALCESQNLAKPSLSPAEIAMAADEQNDEICSQTMALFFEILGQVSGDTALALGAYDGIFIGGGITQRYPEQLTNSRYRAGFENKGRYRGIMETIPSWLISHQNPGLLGASVYARQYLV